MTLSALTANRKDLNTGLAAMEHRHFATVANIIRELPTREDRRRMAEHFAPMLSCTNPKFNRDRFIAACLLLGD